MTFQDLYNALQMFLSLVRSSFHQAIMKIYSSSFPEGYILPLLCNLSRLQSIFPSLSSLCSLSTASRIWRENELRWLDHSTALRWLIRVNRSNKILLLGSEICFTAIGQFSKKFKLVDGEKKVIICVTKPTVAFTDTSFQSD